MITHSSVGSKSARIYGARSWADTDEENELFIELSDKDNDASGTSIKIRLAEQLVGFFNLSFEEIVFALRTKTALGSTNFIWSAPLNCDVRLRHVDTAGSIREDEFDCDYLLPVEGLKPDDMLSFSDYLDWRREGDRTDAEKRRKLKDKIIVTSGKKYQAGRELKYWSCFVPARAVWKKLSEIQGLPQDEEADLLRAGDDMLYGYKFAGGLATSSKGMPTGIALELKPRGSAGYFPNFFILIEDPSLSFDIGRKYIQGRQQGMLRDLAYEQFRFFINDVVKYISGTIEDPDPSYDREELFQEISSLADLDSASSRFVKRPNSQEATVAAMFFEQMGKGGFKEFRPLVSGYKARYDLYGKIGARSQVVEFKFDLTGLFRDFSEERKMFDEINTVILWEITEKDRNLVASRGLTLTEIGAGVLTHAPSRFPSAHYNLNLDGVKSIEIVSMRKLLKPLE